MIEYPIQIIMMINVGHLRSLSNFSAILGQTHLVAFAKG